jgi:hypothetical protein
MLGRFAFTSSFSRRSSRGFRMGSRRFGFCCCDRRGLLNVLIHLAPIPSIFVINPVIAAAQSQHRPARRSLAMFRDTHMGPAQSHALGGRRFLARRSEPVISKDAPLPCGISGLNPSPSASESCVTRGFCSRPPRHPLDFRTVVPRWSGAALRKIGLPCDL